MSDFNMIIDENTSDFKELYEHRIELYIALCKTLSQLSDQPGAIFEIWRTELHSDGSRHDGWFVLGLNNKPGEQITYHLPMSKWDECSFAKIVDCAAKFDGHTSQDVLDRLRRIDNLKTPNKADFEAAMLDEGYAWEPGKIVEIKP